MTFSIVIATFNPGKNLASAIQSILDQVFKDFEIIIQDNVSTDPATLQVFRQYQDQIQLSIEKDLGIYDAFNKALKKCQGQWVIFLGSDDVFFDALVLKKITEQCRPCDKLILGKIKNILIENSWVPSVFQSQMTRNILWRNTIHQQGCCYERQWLMTHPFPDHAKILGDYAIHLQAYLEKVSVRKTSILFAKCQANGISKQFNKALYNEERMIKKEILPRLFYILNLPWIQIKCWIKST